MKNAVTQPIQKDKNQNDKNSNKMVIDLCEEDNDRKFDIDGMLFRISTFIQIILADFIAFFE